MRKTGYYSANDFDFLEEGEKLRLEHDLRFQPNDSYAALIQSNVGNDAAGYAAPQGLRKIMIISATPYQWKHMIGQRVCRRNTAETRIVMLKIWQELYELSPILFAPEQTGAFCQRDYCKEGMLSCGEPIYKLLSPSHILRLDYPALFTEDDNENTAD